MFDLAQLYIYIYICILCVYINILCIDQLFIYLLYDCCMFGDDDQQIYYIANSWLFIFLYNSLFF